MCRKSSPIHLTPTNSSISDQGISFSVISPAYREASNQPSPCPRQSSAPPHLSNVETCPSILWEDLELMRHFVTDTYVTCSCVPSIRDLWQTTIPKMASDHPFMMHSLLSISALHLAFLNPTKRSLYLAAAIRHHDLFLPVYRSQLHNITVANSSAMFICSIFISLCTLAFPICSNNPPSTSPGYYNHLQRQQFGSPIQLITSIFSLLQGASTVVRDSWPWLKDSPISALFLNRFQSLKIESDAKSRLGSSDSAFQLLMTRINSLSSRSSPTLSSLPASLSFSSRHTSSSVLSSEELGTYSNAVSTLQKVFNLINSSDTDNGVVLTWPFFLEGEWGFAALLKDMRPLALVILAYYGVALHAFRSDWYIGDWGRQLVLDVESTLALVGGEIEEVEWGKLMAWPLEMVKNAQGLDKG